MKNRRILTKSEWGLLVLTALFLILMVGLAERSDAPGEAGTYTITTRRPAQEPVVPESALPVNINTATAEELDVLPGIGPALAGRIIAYRESNGPFESIEEIMEVSGIGEAKFAELKDQITVDDEGETANENSGG